LLCSHTRGDIHVSCTIFKENKDNYVVKGGNLGGSFFSQINDYRE
jgi:hypothetical protein